MQGAAARSSSSSPSQIVPQNKEKCPRCNSLNTKFCYYNNYSLSQPRYFCKSCRRYWTHGGTLRNVPVGGGSRKSKRPKTIPSSTSSTAAADTQSVSPCVPGVFAYAGGGYLPTSLEPIQSADLGVYSFGLSDPNWPHRSFGDGGGHNPTWNADNDNDMINNSSSAEGNYNNSSSAGTQNNGCSLVPNHQPVYAHPP